MFRVYSPAIVLWAFFIIFTRFLTNVTMGIRPGQSQYCYWQVVCHGSPGSIVPWMCSLLDNCRQCFRYNQTLSNYAKLTTGVPQGTKLGPFTFQVIIEDAACNSNTSSWKYVDDLTFEENRVCKDGNKMQADLDDFWNCQKRPNWNLKIPSAKLFKYALWETHLRISTLRLEPNP